MKMRAELTTESPVSHYGIPVLRVLDEDDNYVDLGPADVMPPGMEESGGSARSCSYWVAAHANAGTLDLEDARSFCRQWPDGPQPE